VPAPVAEPTPEVEGVAFRPLEFTSGFAFLKLQLGPTMGVPIETEYTLPDTCDTVQRTTTGLAYWRCDTNTLSFAADPDGLVHWAWLDRLVMWRGEGADPPEDAVTVASVPSLLDLPIGSCVVPGPMPSAACTLDGGAVLPGYIIASGQTNAYRFDLAESDMLVVADLLDLPADYDLYLVDGAGGVVAESLQEGPAAEEVQAWLAAGTYYLYVHSDPGRAFDPLHPYTLQLSISPASLTTAAPPAPETP
jgi:hypothetical protein